MPEDFSCSRINLNVSGWLFHRYASVFYRPTPVHHVSNRSIDASTNFPETHSLTASRITCSNKTTDNPRILICVIFPGRKTHMDIFHSIRPSQSFCTRYKSTGTKWPLSLNSISSFVSYEKMSRAHKPSYNR